MSRDRWQRCLATSQSAPEGTRTPNLLIRSQMLYPLSYGRLARQTADKPSLSLPEPARPFQRANATSATPARNAPSDGASRVNQISQ
jgi:hypothetical protein